jgi:hypothetical protein
MTSPVRSDSLPIVQTLFTIVNVTDAFPDPEKAFWTLTDCSPVVAVSCRSSVGGATIWGRLEGGRHLVVRHIIDGSQSVRTPQKCVRQLQ